MSVLFKALQRAEKSRSGNQGDGGDRDDAAPDVPPGMPAVGAADRASARARIARAARKAAREGEADDGPRVSTGRRVARALAIGILLTLASAGTAMVLFKDDLELVLADLTGDTPPPQVARLRPPPAEEAPTATADAAPTVAEPSADADADAPDQAPRDTAPATTNIAALMEAGRRARDQGGTGAADTTAPTDETPPKGTTTDQTPGDQTPTDGAGAGPTVAPPPGARRGAADPGPAVAVPAKPPTPRGVEDVLGEAERTRAAAALKPPISVERQEALRAGAPQANVQVDLQASQTRDLIASSYRALLRGDYHTALDGYESALDGDPGSLPALLGKAAALHKLRRLEDARAAYEAVLGREPSNREALTNLIDIIALASPREALQRLRVLQEKAPDFGPVAAQMGLLQARLGELAPAIMAMRRAVALEPGNALYRYNLAILQDRAGDRRAAAASYRGVLDAMSAGAAIGVSRDAIHDRLRYLTAPQR